MPKHKLTKEQVQEAFDMKVKGYTHQKIADKFSVTRQNIDHMFKNKFPFQKRRFQKRFTREQERDIVQLYMMGGISMRAIANRGICSYVKLSRLINEMIPKDELEELVQFNKDIGKLKHLNK